jgi:hypothetical protein
MGKGRGEGTVGIGWSDTNLASFSKRHPGDGSVHAFDDHAHTQHELYPRPLQTRLGARHHLTK